MTDQQTPPLLQGAPTPFEVQKWLEDIRRQDAYRSHDRWDSITDTLDEAAIKASENGLRAAILINGGAAVSVLAFIGGLASKDLIKIDRLAEVASSLMIFGIGVLLAAIGIGLSYCTHYFSGKIISTFQRGFDHPYVTSSPKGAKWTICRNIVHVLAFVAGIASLVFFGWGMYSVKVAITHLGSPAMTSLYCGENNAPSKSGIKHLLPSSGNSYFALSIAWKLATGRALAKSAGLQTETLPNL